MLRDDERRWSPGLVEEGDGGEEVRFRFEMRGLSQAGDSSGVTFGFVVEDTSMFSPISSAIS